MRRTGTNSFALMALGATALLLHAGPAAASWSAVQTSLGQRVVISTAYADNSYTSNGQAVAQYANTVLTIRNADTANPIKLTSLRFYNSSGVLVKNLLAAPLTIRPLASARFQLNKAVLGVNPYPVAQAACTTVLEWQSTVKVVPPVIGSVLYQFSPDGTGADFKTAADQRHEVVFERAVP